MAETPQILTQGQETVLKPGQVLSLAYDPKPNALEALRLKTPLYLVGPIKDGKLNLYLLNRAENYKPVLEIEPSGFDIGRDTITGEKAEAEKQFISKDHGKLGWSAEHGAFVYTHKGSNPAAIHNPEHPEKQAGEISRLVFEMKRVEPDINKAMKFEAPTHIYPYAGGADTEKSLYAYELLINAFKLTNAELLSDQEKTALDANMGVISALEKDRIMLRAIEEGANNKDSIDNYKKENRDTYPYAAQLQQLVESKFRELEEKNEAYFVSSVRRHHAITKIVKRDTGYFLISYNAGFESPKAKEDPKDEDVLGTCEREIKLGSPDKIKSLMRAICEKKIRRLGTDPWIELRQEIEGYLGKVTRSHQVSPQHKDNCTTRSTREMLRDNLPSHTFANMYKFVSDPERNHLDSIIESLETKHAALEMWGKNQQPQYKINPELERIVQFRPPVRGKNGEIILQQEGAHQEPPPDPETPQALKGDKGEKGEPGEKGERGPAGPSGAEANPLWLKGGVALGSAALGAVLLQAGKGKAQAAEKNTSGNAKESESSNPVLKAIGWILGIGVPVGIIIHHLIQSKGRS